NVRVAVDESRQDQSALGVDGLFGLDAFREEETVADGIDGVAANGDLAVLDDPAVAIHREDGGVRDEQINAYGLFCRSLGKAFGGTKENKKKRQGNHFCDVAHEDLPHNSDFCGLKT